MVYVLTVLWTGFIIATVLLGWLRFPDLAARWLTFVGLSLFIGFVNLTLNQLGYTRFASISLTLMIWLLVTISCYSAGGIMAPGISSQVSVILTAGFLLGWRGGLVIGLMTIGADFGMVYMELNGSLPVPSIQHNPLTRWVGTIIPFATILALQYYATEHLRSGLLRVQREIVKRKEAESITNQTVYSLQKRVKELKTLSSVSRILQDEEAPLKDIFSEIANVLPSGWQYPDITAVRICFASTVYATENFHHSDYCQQVEVKTESGSILRIEVLYLDQVPEMDEGPFMKEERNLINLLADMMKTNLERRGRRAELNDYKYALDIGYMVSISGADNCFTYVNDNFCKTSKYSPHELLGKKYGIIMSDYHPSEYFTELGKALHEGKPYRGEFCNRAKDGTLYWVDTTVVPFLDEAGNVYQYLTINHDITERKAADDKIKQSEQLLKKITSQIPGNTYMFEIEEDGNNNILFMSRGKDVFNYNYEFNDLSKAARALREFTHPDDQVKFNEAMKSAYKTLSPLSLQYRVVLGNNIRWRWLQAAPEKDINGKILWYGASNDITPLLDYITSIEQIIFDIGHVIRRPVSSMLGMSKLIFDGVLTENEIRDISKKLYLISEEMDKFIHELNHEYQKKRQDTNLNIDLSSLIDKRNSLFN